MLRVHYFWILTIPLMRSSNIVSVDKTAARSKYCRDKERLVTSEENDEYLLVSAELNEIVVLECRFCDVAGEAQPKIWHYQDRYRENAEVVVEFGMDNNSSYNRIYGTPDLSLVIKDLAVADAGIYLCHGEEGQEIENKFNYRIEPVLKEYGVAYAEQGNISDWEKYREIYLSSATTRFAVSRMSDLVAIREDGVILQVVTEWARWSPCEHCVRNRGYKTRKGLCQLRRYIDSTMADKNDSVAIKLFRKSPALPCKSTLLQEEFPIVSDAVRYIPEFILKESCKICPKVKQKKGKKFKYTRRYVLAEGAYLTVTCPESNLDTQVVWKRDSITLEKGITRSFRKVDPLAHVMIDTFSTLYLMDVSKHDEGNYTCYADNANVLQFKVIVVSKTQLLTQEFLRHLGYLGFIFFLSLLCYCTGVIVACRRRHRFNVTESRDASAEPEERIPFAGQPE